MVLFDVAACLCDAHGNESTEYMLNNLIDGIVKIYTYLSTLLA